MLTPSRLPGSTGLQQTIRLLSLEHILIGMHHLLDTSGSLLMHWLLARTCGHFHLHQVRYYYIVLLSLTLPRCWWWWFWNCDYSWVIPCPSCGWFQTSAPRRVSLVFSRGISDHLSHDILDSNVAQEGGLLGSQAVATSYAAEGVKVYAMSQVCIFDHEGLSLMW